MARQIARVINFRRAITFYRQGFLPLPVCAKPSTVFYITEIQYRLERTERRTRKKMYWLLLVLLLWIVIRPYYWYVRKVPCMLPLPIFGNALSIFYTGMLSYYQWVYDSFDSRFAGFHIFTKPILFVKDPDLVQEILVRSHDCFSSHGLYINRERDPMGGSVFHLEGDEWKVARSKITPQFTPAKLAQMSQMSGPSFEKLVGLLSDEGVVEMKSALTQFSTDMTTTALFGFETDSFERGSDFQRLTKEMFAEESSSVIFVSLISKRLFDFLKLTTFSKWANDFISNLIKKILSFENADVKNVIQGLKSLRDKDFDDNFIISQAAIIFSGGIETTATTLAHSLYELALNQELQERARREALGDGEIGYIDMVISETLRKYPQFGIVTRGCTREFRIPNSDVVIDPGTFVIIPVYSIQNDPRYYPRPNEFDPLRFSEDNKKLTTPGTYLPFGLGPRTCIGKKFSQASTNKCLSGLLRKFRFSRCSKTEIPLKVNPKAFFTTPLNGVWLRVDKLTENDL